MIHAASFFVGDVWRLKGATGPHYKLVVGATKRMVHVQACNAKGARIPGAAVFHMRSSSFWDSVEMCVRNLEAEKPGSVEGNPS